MQYYRVTLSTDEGSLIINLLSPSKEAAYRYVLDTLKEGGEDIAKFKIKLDLAICEEDLKEAVPINS